MDTAFLTGATGFVGASLARNLLARGLKVKALVRKGGDRRNVAGLALELIEGNLGDKSAIETGVAGCRYVFHVAADYRLWVRDPLEMRRANVDGTEMVLRAAARSGAERIVHCSSVAAIPPVDGNVPADEFSEYRSEREVVGPYKQSKLSADLLARRLAKEEGLPIVLVNPAAPVGPRDVKPTPTGKIILDFLRGRMPSYIDTGLNIVHVDDVAQGHWLAALKGRVGERYILGGDNVSLQEFLENLAFISGLPAPRFKTPYAVAYAFGAVDSAIARLRGVEPMAPLDAIRMAKKYMWYTSAKAESELGYVHRPSTLAIKAAVDWFVEAGYAPKVEGVAAQ